MTLEGSVRASVWSAVRYNQPGGQLMETQSQEVRILHHTHNLLWVRAVGIFSLSLRLFVCVCVLLCHRQMLTCAGSCEETVFTYPYKRPYSGRNHWIEKVSNVTVKSMGLL